MRLMRPGEKKTASGSLPKTSVKLCLSCAISISDSFNDVDSLILRFAKLLVNIFTKILLNIAFKNACDILVRIRKKV